MSVNLGFCEDISEGQKWRLDRCFFPSKVGGSPVWLNPSAMSASQCDSCKSNLKFLLQTYAQGDTEDSFHRSIFVFVCSSKNYCNAPPVIIRQQLPRDNKFYPSTAPNYEVRI
jgi:pre-rRNA-processing protein TSR4